MGFPIAFDALIYRHTGFGLQARYVLAVWMIVPILSGEFLRSRAEDRLAVAVPVSAAVALLALLQLAAWLVNARQSAGRHSFVWFLHGVSWSPPLGWWPWLLSAAVGSALIIAAAVRGVVSEPARVTALGQLPWNRARGN